jgi:HK97 family phage portal protein
MAFSFFDIFRRREVSNRTEIIELCSCLDADGLELQFREAAFWGCVNLIANAVGKCEVREFRGGRQQRGPEWYLWNVQPNRNQSASAFWHKLVAKAYSEGEALIVKEPYGDGIVVADAFDIDDERPVYAYKNIQVGKRKIERLTEAEVLYIRPNWKNIEPLIRKMGDSFLKLMASSMQNYLFNGGQHWKVHVDQVLTADDEWRENFTKMMEKQIKPFLNSASAILPEMDGYTYTQVSGNSAGAVKSDEIRNLIASIWAETSRAFLIPSALIAGNQQDTTVANRQFLTDVIDPLARMIEQEANRKRFTMQEYLAGDRLTVDTSAIVHFDVFSNAANVEKIIGSGLKSVNELRALIGDSPIDEEWADRHFMTKNIGTTTEAEGGENA